METMTCDEPEPPYDVENNTTTDTMTSEIDDRDEDAPPGKLPCTEEYMATAERLLQRDSIHKDSDGDAADTTASTYSTSSADITPGMVEELNRQIDRLDDKPTYDLANNGLKSKYINRREIAEKFLRAERYRPDRAANRLNCFLDTAFEYFGPQALIRPVRISE